MKGIKKGARSKPKAQAVVDPKGDARQGAGNTLFGEGGAAQGSPQRMLVQPTQAQKLGLLEKRLIAVSECQFDTGLPGQQLERGAGVI